MEELLELKDLLIKGDIKGALAIAEELEEMSRDDKITAIGSYAVIMLLHLMALRYLGWYFVKKKGCKPCSARLRATENPFRKVCMA